MQNGKIMTGNGNTHETFVTDFLKERLKSSLNECDKPRTSSENPGQREPDSSDILTRYLQNVKYLARRKRRRWISQELER